MDFLTTTLGVIISSVQNISPIIPVVLGVAELITRLTPTKKDDGFIERIGSSIRKGLDLLQVPNKKKDK